MAMELQAIIFGAKYPFYGVVGINAPVPGLVGINDGIAGDSTADYHMVQFVLLGSQARLDISQALPVGIVVEAGELPDFEDAAVPL